MTRDVGPKPLERFLTPFLLTCPVARSVPTKKTESDEDAWNPEQSKKYEASEFLSLEVNMPKFDDEYE
jgi:hypothetical protein